MARHNAQMKRKLKQDSRLSQENRGSLPEMRTSTIPWKMAKVNGHGRGIDGEENIFATTQSKRHKHNCKVLWRISRKAI